MAELMAGSGDRHAAPAPASCARRAPRANGDVTDKSGRNG